MKNEKIACIVFLILALFISLVLSGLPFLVSFSDSSLPNIEGLQDNETQYLNTDLTTATLKTMTQPPHIISDIISEINTNPNIISELSKTYENALNPQITASVTRNPTTLSQLQTMNKPTPAPSQTPSQLTPAPSQTPSQLTPTPSQTPSPLTAQQEYNIINNVVTDLANYAIEKSGKENEALIEKNIILKDLNELKSIAETSQTTTGVVPSVEMLKNMVGPIFNSTYNLMQMYANPDIVHPDSINKSSAIIYERTINIAFLALYKIDPQMWAEETKKRQK